MGETRRKLDEARFFLDLMEKHPFEVPDFAYYLSAFISAARSVLWVMRAEYAHVDGWEAWFGSKNADPELREFLSRVNSLRVRAVKRGTPTANGRVEITIRRENFTPELELFFRENARKKIRVVLDGFRQEDPPAPAPTIVEKGRADIPGIMLSDVYQAVEEFPDEDILKVARRYYTWLKGVVHECEDRFEI